MSSLWVSIVASRCLRAIKASGDTAGGEIFPTGDRGAGVLTPLATRW